MSHPHLGATYELVDPDDVTAEVIVTIPDMRPTTIKGFATKALAKKWIKRRWRPAMTCINASSSAIVAGLLRIAYWGVGLIGVLLALHFALRALG